MARLPNSANDEETPDFWVGMDPTLTFRDPLALGLLAYWNEKRGDRPMPARRDIDPLDLPDHLGNLVLIEVEHEPLRLRYRLIGTRITSAMERDSTGKYYDEVYEPAIIEHVYDSFRWILRHKAPLRTHGQAFYPDKNFYDYETLNLPLSDDGVTVNMVLGELIFHLASGASSRR